MELFIPWVFSDEMVPFSDVRRQKHDGRLRSAARSLPYCGSHVPRTDVNARKFLSLFGTCAVGTIWAASVSTFTQFGGTRGGVGMASVTSQASTPNESFDLRWLRTLGRQVSRDWLVVARPIWRGVGSCLPMVYEFGWCNAVCSRKWTSRWCRCRTRTRRTSWSGSRTTLKLQSVTFRREGWRWARPSSEIQQPSKNFSNESRSSLLVSYFVC